jgi:methyl-accepting chemotaxis protein
MAAIDITVQDQAKMLNDTSKKIMQLGGHLSFVQNVTHAYQDLISDILGRIGSVNDIANKTNLLAINATIETIHASDLLASFQKIVGSNLLIQAKLLAEILTNDPDFMYQDGAKFAAECGIEEFYVTDGRGAVLFTNISNKKNALLNSAETMHILENKVTEVIFSSTSNSIGNEQYKAAAIARKDEPGLIQFGAHFVKPSGQVAIDGFGVVAKEAKRLADMSRDISASISKQTDEMIENITELNDLSNALGETYSTVTDSSVQSVEALAALKTQTKELQQKFEEIRHHFKSILAPLSNLISLARQTSLLGVRASIEAASSTNEKEEFDELLNVHMKIEAKLAAFLVERIPDISCDDIVSITENCGIAEMWITDPAGVVELTNVSGGAGFVFKNEGQTAPYMALLTNPDLCVTAPPAVRALDNCVYKYVGICRKDKPGIFQVGCLAKLYGDSTAKGFSEVSRQIKQLAEQSKLITGEIQDTFEDMNAKAQKALDNLVTANQWLHSEF